MITHNARGGIKVQEFGPHGKICGNVMFANKGGNAADKRIPLHNGPGRPLDVPARIGLSELGIELDQPWRSELGRNAPQVVLDPPHGGHAEAAVWWRTIADRAMSRTRARPAVAAVLRICNIRSAGRS